MRSRATHPRALLRLVASSHSTGNNGRQAATQTLAAGRRSSILHSTQRAAASSSSRPVNSFISPNGAATCSSSSVSQFRAYVAPSTAHTRRRASIAKRRASRSSSDGNGEASAKGSADLLSAKRRSALDRALTKLNRGHAPARPPPTTSEEVGMQTFFSTYRPLLEHAVRTSWSAGSDGGTVQGSFGALSSEMDFPPKEVQELVSNVVAKHGDRLRGGTLIAVVTDVSEMPSGPSIWPNALRNVTPSRFSRLLDSLSESPSSSSPISQTSLKVVMERHKMAEELRREKECAEAVANAVERGEDPTVARALGGEADTVILGEPSGPQADWSPGVASFMAKHLRAFEPPSAPDARGRLLSAPQTAGSSMPHFGRSGVITLGEGEEFDDEDVADRLSSMFTDAMNGIDGASFGGNVHGLPPSNVEEDAPNLLLSHAMVQAALPNSLAWDRLVGQMDAAALDDASIARGGVNPSLLNADPLPPDHELHVSLDSVRRKRKKKMRKHKYKKLRKRTRIQRQQQK
ncbi:hypothetical protein IE81DRAFT_323458 [Ceraceosorus guamensis]|uniref:Small ribosomal subunit protein mS38 n=1 Tax=Ceraceosorus guamensis TaxID=1522189 RepID=A0A316VYC4_9BASI|nr:hypothetical protein IE81DRAFT_323458 [Ceraceosorus guamensis]PWN42490.1 hypothetical protein IE81DRAFT_323458 [Ceraceosorus guamensis]